VLDTPVPFAFQFQATNGSLLRLTWLAELRLNPLELKEVSVFDWICSAVREFDSRSLVAPLTLSNTP